MSWHTYIDTYAGLSVLSVCTAYTQWTPLLQFIRFFNFTLGPIRGGISLHSGILTSRFQCNFISSSFQLSFLSFAETMKVQYQGYRQQGWIIKRKREKNDRAEEKNKWKKEKWQKEGKRTKEKDGQTNKEPYAVRCVVSVLGTAVSSPSPSCCCLFTLHSSQICPTFNFRRLPWLLLHHVPLGSHTHTHTHVLYLAMTMYSSPTVQCHWNAMLTLHSRTTQGMHVHGHYLATLGCLHTLRRRNLNLAQILPYYSRYN